MIDLAEAGAALLGGSLSKTVVLHGGDLSQVVMIALDDGREAIVKNGPAPRTEATMLKAIAQTGAPAPAVLAVGDEALAIEMISAEGSLAGAWANLGSVLATLHGATGDRYGWNDNYAFGSVPIENEWSDDWAAFWGRRRLLAHLPHVNPQLGRRLEALATDLPNRLPTRPRTALLHGDLWGGNVLVEGDRVSGLIDPACYYGHVEVDLAMLSLFDNPSDEFYSAYGAMEPGRDERLAVYQLWPALVHLRLFGDGYRPMVERLLSTAGV